MPYKEIVCDSGDSTLDSAVYNWMKNDRNPKTIKEVVEDVQAMNWSKLRKTMLSRQKFGTAGMRGKMAAGFKCMNDLVILQTAQGLCSYLQKHSNQDQLHNGIVIGFDGRHNSKRFAELTAKVFISSSIPVHIFSAVCPTPLVSFATVKLGAAAGVMVTASHNPKDDNGYKVYRSNGTQIIAPQDDNILDEILQCLDVPEDHWNIDEILSHELVRDCLKDMTTAYMSYIKDSLNEDVLSDNKKAAIDIVYSAMHGVGYEFVVKAFESANLKRPKSVSEQETPNPDFPTVHFPNPEELECLSLGMELTRKEGARLLLVNDPDADRLAVAEYDKKLEAEGLRSLHSLGQLYQGRDDTIDSSNPEDRECLSLGMELTRKEGARLLLVNDPDADRLAVAEYDTSKSSWKIFTGNEMGSLLGWWILKQYWRRQPAAASEDVYVIASVVSSKMLAAIVRGRGEFVETLTGFKWMGNTTLLLQQQGKIPLFAYEEAIGYMCDPQVPDKDGVSAAVHVASLASNLYSNGSTLKEQLTALYKEYGYHLSHNSYYICEDPAIIQKIFRRIRNYDGPGQYPKKVGSSEIVYINDLAAGVKIPEKAEGDAHLKVLGTGLDLEYTSGEMVMFRTKSGLSVTVRTSGTEPKVKYYTELVHKAGANSFVNEEEMRSKLKAMVQEFVEELLQPAKHGLGKAPAFEATH